MELSEGSDRFAQMHTRLTKWGTFAQLTTEQQVAIVTDIVLIWDFMTKEDRIVIFGNDPENLVIRYFADVLVDSGSPHASAQLMTHLANTLIYAFRGTGNYRTNTDLLVQGWRNYAIRV